MKTPIWEPSPGALVQWLLENTSAKPITLWTLRRRNGTVARYSGTDITLDVNGTAYTLGPHFSRTRTSQRIGVSVDSMAVLLIANESHTIDGVPIMHAFARGDMGGDWLQTELAFYDPQMVLQGVVGGFGGRIGSVKSANRGQVQFDVRSITELLDVQVPAEVFQPGCINRLGDARCGVAMASFTVTGAVSTAAATKRTITSTSAAVIGKPTGWGALGTLTFTSGALSGQSRPVRAFSVSGGVATIDMMYQTTQQAAAGDTFTLAAGCDKTRGTCDTRFANVVRFRGMPYVPPPETVA